MDAISVIIITKNEADNISNCIKSARLVSNDILVVDSGSTDVTIYNAQHAGAKVISIEWTGFGAARNAGSVSAQNDWVLAIDADERVTENMAVTIKKINFNDDFVIYGFKRQNYFLGKKIRFGQWGRDTVYRLYNRKHVSWDLSPVHEHLIGEHTNKQMLKGVIDHYPVVREEQNSEKTIRYATLNAEKYFKQGKRSTLEKRYLSPVFDFVKSYIFLLGFLDGKQGFVIARSTSRYVQLKYRFLHQLNKSKTDK